MFPPSLARQAVCIWTLALLLRAIGLRNGASNLWEPSGAAGNRDFDVSFSTLREPGRCAKLGLARFCNGDALCATILVKGALSFQRGRRETSCARVPHDLAQLQKAILSSALGLSHPSLVFDGEGEADVGIAERQEQLLSHCALLAAASLKTARQLVHSTRFLAPNWLRPWPLRMSSWTVCYLMTGQRQRTLCPCWLRIWR